MKAEEVKPLASHLQVHDAGLGRLRLQAETGQQARQARQRLLGLAAGPAHHDQESRRGESHPPPLAEPCGSLSAYTAPIVQPSGLRPNRQWANKAG